MVQFDSGVVEVIGIIIGAIGTYLSLKEAMFKKLSEFEMASQRESFENDKRCDEIESLARRNEANIKMLLFLLEFLSKYETIQRSSTDIGNTSVPTE